MAAPGPVTATATAATATAVGTATTVVAMATVRMDTGRRRSARRQLAQRLSHPIVGSIATGTRSVIKTYCSSEAAAGRSEDLCGRLKNREGGLRPPSYTYSSTSGRLRTLPNGRLSSSRIQMFSLRTVFAFVPCRRLRHIAVRRARSVGASGRCDCGPPRLHRRGPKRAVRLGRGEMALDVPAGRYFSPQIPLTTVLKCGDNAAQSSSRRPGLLPAKS